ncbi:hypothetical protein M1O47_01540 [Dehalococcoidia bacterium]|nr:hypothetical protein [Dehalococcoidia bacterium]
MNFWHCAMRQRICGKESLMRLKRFAKCVKSGMSKYGRASHRCERRYQERIYDSLYAAFAQLRRCDFWTDDKAFYEAVKSELSFVKYLH